MNELSYWGFLSWNEIAVMVNSGLIDIQSHSSTHTSYFQGPEVVDFHHPGDKYPWLAWNKYPDRKYLWPIEDQESFVEYGSPIYTFGRALGAPQYFPDGAVALLLEGYVKQHGGRDFFKNSGWKTHLSSIVIDYRRHNRSIAKYESQSEYEERVRGELARSKEIIERHTGKQVRFLCWPGGAFNQTTLRIAQEVGYLATTKGQSKNMWGADPRRIDRLSGNVPSIRVHPLVDRYAGLSWFVANVESYRGTPVYGKVLPLMLRTIRLCRRFLRALRGMKR